MHCENAGRERAAAHPLLRYVRMPLLYNPPRYTIHVNGPWCITFEWEGDGPSRVDLEQYH